MPSHESPSIAVVGAAGFVGRELLRQFEEAGTRVTAIVRGFPELSVDGTFHRTAAAAELRGERFDLVINLAYPTSGALFEQADANQAIIDTVTDLVTDAGRLIHVSTIAVFGMTLNKPISVGPVKKFRDMAYVESKIDAEQQFAELQIARRLSLDIVRLGNVWGRASGAWALPTVRNLISGRPAAVAGVPGFSNTTDVANVASYLVFLAQNGTRASETRFQHLAEFSSVRWNEWIDPMAEAMGVEPVYAEPHWLDAPGTSKEELAAAVAPLKVRELYATLASERVVGSVLRSTIRRLPTPVQGKLRSDGIIYAATPELGRIEQIVLTNMAGHQEFRSSTQDGWTPRITQAESLERVLRWIAQD